MLKPTSDLQQSHDFFHSLDIIMGGTSLEGALYLFVFAHELNTTDTNLVVPKSFYESFLVPKILSDVYDDLSAIPQVVKDITVFEYTDWNNPNDDKERLKMLIDLTTDTAVKAPTVSTIQLHSTGGGGNTYLYEFSVRPDSRYFHVPSWIDGPEVAAHGEDLGFLFRLSDETIHNLKLNISDSNKRTSKAIMTMWTNFAKTGDPNMPNSITPYLPTIWQQYQMTSQKYLEITPTMTTSSVKENIAAEKMQFWLHYLPSLLKL